MRDRCANLHGLTDWRALHMTESAPAPVMTQQPRAPWIERIGGPISTLGFVALLGILAVDIALLLFDYTPPDWLLSLLRLGPVGVAILGVVANLGTVTHWLRIILRRERLSIGEEAKGQLEGMGQDKVSGALGTVDDQLRQRPDALRGCREALRGCGPRLALTLLLAAAITTAATLGPFPV